MDTEAERGITIVGHPDQISPVDISIDEIWELTNKSLIDSVQTKKQRVVVVHSSVKQSHPEIYDKLKSLSPELCEVVFTHDLPKLNGNECSWVIDDGTGFTPPTQIRMRQRCIKGAAPHFTGNGKGDRVRNRQQFLGRQKRQNNSYKGRR